jgi:hypothetical protein
MRTGQEQSPPVESASALMAGIDAIACEAIE